MRKLIVIAALFVSLAASAQQQSIYSKQWEEIDSLIILKDLPKSALEKVNMLYADAKAKGLHDEVIKALLYKVSFSDKTTDEDINKQVQFLQQELNGLGDPVSQGILSALFANNLYRYLQDNFQKNRDRTKTSYKEADITTWTRDQLIETIDSLYGLALQNKTLLQQTNTNVISAILMKGNMPGTRPTVYDLLAHMALDYYSNNFSILYYNDRPFNHPGQQALAPAADFMNYNFSNIYALNLLKTMQLFQQLLQFHQKDADPSAYIDVNLERIQWVYNNTYLDNKKELYKQALLDITTAYTNTKPAAQAWYLLATLEADNASAYAPFEDTTERYGYVKAKQLIEGRLKAMPDSCFGNNQMKSLLNDIMQPVLKTQAESVNVAGAPSRLLVNYKNIDTLYARVLLQKDISKAAKKKHYDQWKDVALITPLKTFQQALPQTNDYQQHSVEIKMDALPVGEYSILFSSSKDFNDAKDKLALQPVTVSDLAYLRNNLDYFVVNRETGQPLQNVKVSGTVQVRNAKKKEWADKKFKPLYTDRVGHFKLPFDITSAGDNYNNIDLVFQKGDDRLETSDYIYTYRYSYGNDDDEIDDSTYEEDNSRVYLFTDRSIYRPGQTIFFKGIILTKDRQTKQQKLYDYRDSIEVDLYGANGKLIDSMYVMMNEYGSFAGKFAIPQNVLTGEFSIETLDFDGETEFNVEEYKRPTFYVEFDTLKGAYRLNDTITITGVVKSYAGSNVDNARISYNIQRTAIFLILI